MRGNKLAVSVENIQFIGAVPTRARVSFVVTVVPIQNNMMFPDVFVDGFSESVLRPFVFSAPSVQRAPSTQQHVVHRRNKETACPSFHFNDNTTEHKGDTISTGKGKRNMFIDCC